MASPFSFHCIVCFEEFDQVERYPVVLPCGHTYICHVCAQKIDKCMECRSPLIERQKVPTSTVQLNSRGLPGLPGRPHPVHGNGNNENMRKMPPPKRCPLPKNVVLLSLMDATEVATQQQTQNRTMDVSPLKTMSKSIAEDEDEDEEEKIRVGTSLAISECGTYVVGSKEGLLVYPSRPMSSPTSFGRSRRKRGSKTPSEDDVDTMVRFFHLDNKTDLPKSSSAEDANGTGTTSNDDVGTLAPPIQLRRGDRVQIVTFEDGWAKLARGYGFVKADEGQLLKVGAAVDRACTLEAKLRALSVRRRQLKKEQSRVDSDFVKLMNSLQSTLSTDEDLTVIGGDTFKDSTQDFDDAEPEIHEDDINKHLHLLIPEDDNDAVDLAKPHRLVRSETPPGVMASRLGCFSSDMLGIGQCSSHGVSPRNEADRAALLARLGAALSFDEKTGTVSSVAIPVAVPASLGVTPPPPPPAINYPFPRATQIPAPMSTPTSLDRERTLGSGHPSPQTLSAGARAWRERNGRAPSTSINFRTGLSGHMALASTAPHPQTNGIFRTPQETSARTMSSHAGLNIYPFSRRSQPRPPLVQMSQTADNLFTGTEEQKQELDGTDFDNRTL
mmetsp:Transcript_38675/g.57514  ORF Transcript_38675/g.57514 Transcript_38675/m.57514 type:complete len:612 (-) Transcript_38675:212-2047(-)|eukprot:CAMPEP_0194031892 /NCGR_PEP_ID=MMETSP0009_2-20130614/4955_1 /TAXON_ID=210454 /ORGANISM="Grammatophora oceanica, Strain CCMP 410" /LENGTH=611 /DNA_ID=CAMNT_0038672159 /DNA_START=31 /DNA_END=1866 /DNA_ORIENTATION=+